MQSWIATSNQLAGAFRTSRPPSSIISTVSKVASAICFCIYSRHLAQLGLGVFLKGVRHLLCRFCAGLLVRFRHVQWPYTDLWFLHHLAKNHQQILDKANANPVKVMHRSYISHPEFHQNSPKSQQNVSILANHPSSSHSERRRQ